ncbi:prepilin-type N-terminal cleavage/methylation domain-containing protein [Vibrio sp. SM6]|uniref:Prepilin-type N-terminal cleavage/methylation domain-containing protein n=1 Tax=Vibrio agarilyticus TaxID=2726741 RepID=A0A7X8TNX0_9VIBR|nr:prepilin-type N-terminal cleavage/methylation domain-containing protein [Vibrio agarilyticus]NLS12213.1 prepilin-type N-terminal cleavage/methylation domain-containing protein [Vibrio agarilyticus]
MKTSKGFTLVEIVITIMVVAILAVVAAPRFLNLSSSAYAANIHGVNSALTSALKLANARIQIDDAQTTLDYQGKTVALTAGNPAASADTLRALLNIDVPKSWTRNWESVPCDEPEFCILGNMFPGKGGYVSIPNFPLSGNNGLDRASYIWPRGYVIKSEGCYAFYINEASKETFHTGSIDAGC